MTTDLNNHKLRLSLILIGFVIIFLASSCAGGNVTKNGVFQDNHQVEQQQLVGEWRTVNTELAIPGEVVYKFTKGAKGKVALNVNGEDVEMMYFDSYDNLSYSFHYLDKDKNEFFVYAQFKNYNKSELLINSGRVTDKSTVQASLEKDNSRYVLRKVIVSNKN